MQNPLDQRFSYQDYWQGIYNPHSDATTLEHRNQFRFGSCRIVSDVTEEDVALRFHMMSRAQSFWKGGRVTRKISYIIMSFVFIKLLYIGLYNNQKTVLHCFAVFWINSQCFSRSDLNLMIDSKLSKMIQECHMIETQEHRHIWCGALLNVAHGTITFSHWFLLCRFPLK